MSRGNATSTSIGLEEGLEDVATTTSIRTEASKLSLRAQEMSPLVETGVVLETFTVLTRRRLEREYPMICDRLTVVFKRVVP